MHVQDTVNIDREQLARWLREKGMSQVSLAQRLGVSPLTVGRWLSGKVRRIGLDNLRRLAAQLELPETALQGSEAVDEDAARRERSTATRLLVSSASRNLFYEAGRLAEYEQLILAMLDPSTSEEDLLDAYSQLIILAAKRGRLDLVERYAALKLRYALATGNSMREQEARVNLLTAQAQSGKLLQSCRALEEMLSAAESAGQHGQAQVALINLVQAYRLRGETGKALKRGIQCILSMQQDKPTLAYYESLCFNISSALTEAGEHWLAERFDRLASTYRQEAPTPLEAAEVRLHGLANSAGGGTAPASLEELQRMVDTCLASESFSDSYSALGARALRRAGYLDAAREYLGKLDAHPGCGVYEPPFIAEEWARLEAAAGNDRAAREWREKANSGFTALGMARRCVADPADESGSGLRAPAGLLRRLSELLDSGALSAS